MLILGPMPYLNLFWGFSSLPISFLKYLYLIDGELSMYKILSQSTDHPSLD